MVQFNLPGITIKGHILLSKPDWFNPYNVTTVRELLLLKVTKFEHELQKEKNVLSLMKRLSSSGGLPYETDGDARRLA